MTALPQIAWPDALPEWDDLNASDQADHIETCQLCTFCEAYRAFGECVTCGAETEALPPFGESRCCGSPVALLEPVQDNLRELHAA